MRRLSVLLFILAFSLDLPPRGLVKLPQAESNPAAVLVAPGIAIGTLETMAAAAAAATYVGIMARSTNRVFQGEISRDIDRVKSTTAEAFNQARTDAHALYNRAVETLKGQQCPSDERGKKANGSTCTASIEECCQDFLRNMGGRAQMLHGALRIMKSSEGKPKVLCCMEWDHLHGGLEIFDPWGRHLGERACDDPNEDPCEWTRQRGKHAEPHSENHKPRTRTCQQ